MYPRFGSTLKKRGRANVRKYYTAIKIDGKLFRVGDIVQLKSGTYEEPYLSRIDELFEENGRKLMLARWFYRPADIPTVETRENIKAPWL